MEPSNQLYREILNWLLLGLLVCASLDIPLTLIAKNKGLKLQNKYFNFHMTHGFYKITFIKVLLIAFISVCLIDPAGNAFVLTIPIFIYAFFILSLIKDLLYGKK